MSCPPMRFGRVTLGRLFGGADVGPDRRGLFSFQFSTLALVSIIQPRFALNLCDSHWCRLEPQSLLP